MTPTIMIYGATGYTGGLIAAEAAQGLPPARLILAARDRGKLNALAKRYDVDFRVFGLDDRQEVGRQLDGVDVLVNAAGPFVFTAERLAKTALEAGCHYVDINEEVGVYRRLDDLARFAVQRNVAMVCSAGFAAAASDLLLQAAMQTVAGSGDVDSLGTVRIAAADTGRLSRGRADALWRSLREQVTVVRRAPRGREPGRQMVASHEPVGRLEHVFDFGTHLRPRDDRARTTRIATAVNSVDTLVARLTVLRNKLTAHSIESYAASNRAMRGLRQIASMLAPLAADPRVRTAVRYPIQMLPEGPTEAELAQERCALVLTVEDNCRTTLVDWCWNLPSRYFFTARIVAEIARQLAGNGWSGWLTPAQVLPHLDPGAKELKPPLRDCRLERRKPNPQAQGA